MPSSPSVPSVAPSPAVYDPAFEARWADWVIRCREHDHAGQRRLKMALAGAAVIVLPVTFFLGVR